MPAPDMLGALEFSATVLAHSSDLYLRREFWRRGGEFWEGLKITEAQRKRVIERKDLAIRDAEPLLQRAMPRIRDSRRAARPSEMQRSRIPLSSPMSVCICRNKNE